MKQGLTYADVLIQPGYSDIDSRIQIDIRSNYLGGLRYPIISAPMDYVTGYDMAKHMAVLGAYGIVNRFTDEPLQTWPDHEYGMAIGANNIEDSITMLLKAQPHSVCIDVAHGYHQKVGNAVERLREVFEDRLKIIAGNVATAEGFYFLAKLGVDAVRVGIGPGSACSTRETTGIGVPQLTAILDVVEAQRFTPNVSIIADGGIQNSGDIVKALAAGADAVMLGYILAGHSETPGKVFWHNGKRLKKYQGQSLLGTNGDRGAPEGIAGTVPYRGSVDKTMESLVNYVKSGFSYVGARNLSEFRNKANFIQVSPGTFAESGTRL